MTQIKIRPWVGFLALSVLFLRMPLASADGETLAVGTGKAKLNGLLQAWVLNDTTATTGAGFNYRLRRAEIELSGSVVDDTRWFAMIDPAKSLKPGAVATTNDNKILQDLGVAFKLCTELELIAGQYKTPTTAEGLDSSAKLLLPERSYVGRTFGDRGIGLMLVYQESILKFSLMAHSGQGTNVDDTDSDKDLSVRVDFTPNDMLKFGTYTTAGNMRFQSKGRWGANVRATIAEFLARAEVVHAQDSGVNSTGWDISAAYQLSERFQPVIRYEGIYNSIFTGTVGTLGLNYFVAKHGAKVQAAYSMLKNMTGTNGSPAPLSDRDGSVFVLVFQAAI